MAGVTPPPGIYVVDTNYYYAGSATGDAAVGVALKRTGPLGRTTTLNLNIDANIKVDAKAYFNVPTAVWVTPQKLLGGDLGFIVATPIGYKDVNAGVGLNARATATLPAPLNLTIQASRQAQLAFGDNQTAFGDPIAAAFIGWHAGNFHWNVTTMANIPLGQWDRGNMANIGFNRWAFDTTAAFTWLDPTVGLELSVAPGYTINLENPDTNYKSGREFHVEFAAMQQLSKQAAIGVTGYHFRQVTGDGGSGAVLGDFKGRVTALGPTLNYNFQLGQLPVMTSLKWMHEFEVENRLRGDMGLLNITIPLGPPPALPK